MKARPPGALNNEPKLDLKNPLFLVMIVIAASAVCVGLTADSSSKPAWALGDNRIYRAEVALAAFLVLYAVVIVLWLAAHKLTLKAVGAGPASAEIPQATQEMADSANRVQKLSEQVQTISESTSEELAYHDVRLKRIEHSLLGRLLPGSVPPPPTLPIALGHGDDASTAHDEENASY